MLNGQKTPVKGAAPQAPRSKVAQRLLVHARLCRQMARASLDEGVGEQLLMLADDCAREAAEIIAAERLSTSAEACG